MKIPTYKAETQRGSGLATQLSNIQTTPDLFGANLAKQVAETGNALAEWGIRRAELRAEVDAAEAVGLLNESLDEIKNNLSVAENPIVAEDFFSSAADEDFKKILGGIETKRAKTLFQRDGLIALDAARQTFNKENRKRIVSFVKDKNNTSYLDRNKFISNTSNSTEARLNTLNQGLSLIDSSEAKLVLTPVERTTRHAKFIKDTLNNTINSMLSNANNPLQMAISIQDGSASDAVLQTLFAQISPTDKTTVLENTLSVATKMFAAKGKLEKQIDDGEEDRAKEATQKFYSNQNPEKWNELYNQLFISGAIKDATSRKQADDFMGLNNVPGFAKPPKKDSSSIETIDSLTYLDRTNQLTPAALNDARSKLSPSDYKSFLGKLYQEQKDGDRDADNLIKRETEFYDQGAEQSGIASSGGYKYLYTPIALKYAAWARGDEITIGGKKPTSSKDATYNDRIDVAKQLVEEFKQEEKAKAPEQLRNYIKGNFLIPAEIKTQLLSTDDPKAIRAFYLQFINNLSEEQRSVILQTSKTVDAFLERMELN